MDQQTLLILLTIFVALAAVAMLIQAAMLIGLFVVSKRTQEKVTTLLPEVQSILAISKRILADAEIHVKDFGNKTGVILETTKNQVVKIDELLTDVGARARVQLERAEMVLDDTVSKAQQTVAIVQSGVVSPIREVQGIVTGIRTAIAHLGRGGRPTVDHATADEEMFI